jgi:hypothetical protein
MQGKKMICKAKPWRIIPYIPVLHPFGAKATLRLHCSKSFQAGVAHGCAVYGAKDVILSNFEFQIRSLETTQCIKSPCKGLLIHWRALEGEADKGKDI